MQRERVSEDIYIFTSDLYAQVNAGAVVSQDSAVLIDTLAFPSETLEIRDYLQNRLGVKVRYVINTHYHSDHSGGTCFFPKAEVVAHRLCRELLDTKGRRALEAAKAETPELATVEIVLPEAVFTEGCLNLHLGRKTLQLFPSPGTSPDSISVLVKEDRILFAGDSMMPVPYIVDGDFDDMVKSLKAIPPMGLENIVQGHGDIILRGEIDETVKAHLKYLDNIRRKAQQAIDKKRPRESLLDVDIESCGASRIPLNGLVTQLHTRNLLALYDRMRS